MNSWKNTQWVCCIFAGVFIALSAAPTQAALILTADFNDISTGSLNGKAGGTGFTGTWSGSSLGQVVTGNLTSSLYGLTQSGTPQHFRNGYNGADAIRQNYRTTSGTPEGEIWFSFLAMTEASGHRAGLSLNAPSASPYNDPGNVYAYLVGDTLNYSFGAGTAGSIAAADVGTTNLILGKMSIVNGGTDSISLWLNPDLIANPDINTLAPIYSSSSFDFIDSLTRIGTVGSGLPATTGGGHLDAIRFSDGSGNAYQAYHDVTGLAAVPEPSSMILASVAAVAGWRLRRRGRVAA